MKRLVLLVAVICGCGSSKSAINADRGGDGGASGPATPSSGDTTSGSRLKARTYVAGDGAKQFNGWHDTQLDVDCSFQTASDGQVRCLPGGMPVSSSGLFLDSTCRTGATSVVLVASCAPPAKLATKVDTTCGSARTHVLQMGGKHAGTLYTGAPGACVSTSDPSVAAIYANFAFYDVGGEVDPGTYLSATEQVL